MVLKGIRDILKKQVPKISTALITGLLAYNLSTTNVRANPPQLEIPSAIVASAMVAYGLFAKDSKTNKKVEIQPYMTLGSIELTENNISEGHKFITSGGVKVSSLEGKLRKRFSLEVCAGGEPSDEDTEIPNQEIYHLNGNLAYHPFKKDNVYFTFGANFDRLERKRNEKYPNSLKRMDFVAPEVGLGVKYKHFGAEAKLNYPARTNTDIGGLHGELGFETSVNFTYRKLIMELFYKKNSFKGTSNQPQVAFEFTGARMGVRF